MCMAGLHFFHAPCLLPDYQSCPSGQGAGLQQIMLRPRVGSVFHRPIFSAMLAHRNKNSGKVGKTKVVALTNEFSVFPEFKSL